jgi:hypothetical protein
MSEIKSTGMLPSVMAAKPDGPASQSGNSFISSLSNVKPEQAAALADKTYLALGKDRMKFSQFLTSFVKAFNQANPSGGVGAASGAAGGSGAVDVGAATQALLAFRNANDNVKNLDQAIGAIAKALPNLTQADFDSLMGSLKATTLSKQPSLGMPPPMKAGGMADQLGQNMNLSMVAPSEIDKFEIGLLEGQIAAAVGKNTASAASATGNPALDAILGDIVDIAKDGVTADEMESLVGILSATATLLLGPEKAEKALANLGLPGSSSSSGSSGSPVSVQINVGADESSNTPSANPVRSTSGSNGFDGMLTVKTNLLRRAMESGMAPDSTNFQAWELFLGGSSALTGGVSSDQEYSKALADSKKQKPVSSVDLS